MSSVFIFRAAGTLIHSHKSSRAIFYSPGKGYNSVTFHHPGPFSIPLARGTTQRINYKTVILHSYITHQNSLLMLNLSWCVITPIIIQLFYLLFAFFRIIFRRHFGILHLVCRRMVGLPFGDHLFAA